MTMNQTDGFCDTDRAGKHLRMSGQALVVGDEKTICSNAQWCGRLALGVQRADVWRTSTSHLAASLLVGYPRVWIPWVLTVTSFRLLEYGDASGVMSWHLQILTCTLEEFCTN